MQAQVIRASTLRLSVGVTYNRVIRASTLRLRVSVTHSHALMSAK